LEQLRFTIMKQDFVRAAIVAGKINRKHLHEMAEYKIRFYTLLSTVHRHDRDAFELVKDYHAIYLTHVQSSMKTDETKDDGVDNDELMEQDDDDTTICTPSTSLKEALKAVVVFLALAPYSNEQQDILNRIAVDTNLEKLPVFQYVLYLLCWS
jgi:26S proteasome regulatory subunit N5